MPHEDEAWRAIVENYGDRAELDPADLPETESDPEPGPEPFSFDGALEDVPDDDRFVPPEPPPLPVVPRDRMLAWAGLFGSPTILLIALVLGVRLPSLIAYVLIAGFIGGFLYLVAQMPRGPQDPFDDGARL